MEKGNLEEGTGAGMNRRVGMGMIQGHLINLVSFGKKDVIRSFLSFPPSYSHRHRKTNSIPSLLKHILFCCCRLLIKSDPISSLLTACIHNKAFESPLAPLSSNVKPTAI